LPLFSANYAQTAIIIKPGEIPTAPSLPVVGHQKTRAELKVGKDKYRMTFQNWLQRRKKEIRKVDRVMLMLQSAGASGISENTFSQRQNCRGR
jgi:hypothetical protein